MQLAKNLNMLIQNVDTVIQLISNFSRNSCRKYHQEQVIGVQFFKSQKGGGKSYLQIANILLQRMAEQPIPCLNLRSEVV